MRLPVQIRENHVLRSRTPVPRDARPRWRLVRHRLNLARLKVKQYEAPEVHDMTMRALDPPISTPPVPSVLDLFTGAAMIRTCAL